MPYYCSVCKETISKSVYEYSMDKFGKALCRDHQKTVTTQALKLSRALNEKGVNHTLEYYDGFKHVDIAIEWAKLFIEIDGSQHLFSPKQAIADYKRDNYSLKDEFYTKRFSNNSIDEDVRSVAESISDLASLRYREISNYQKTITPEDTSKTLAEAQPKKPRANRKATLIFASIILILCISIAAVSAIMLNRIDTLQTTNNSLESQLSSLQTNLNSLQSQYNQLNTEYQQLQQDPSSQSSQIAELQNQIASLQAQLIEANDIIAQLQGQTGILPTYMDLARIGDNYFGSFYLQISTQNTGASPITQIFVTLSSVQIPMNFTYLDTTVNADTPLPAYQTASGRANVTPPIPRDVITTYPLIIQATAINGTVYNYQTNLTAHT